MSSDADVRALVAAARDRLTDLPAARSSPPDVMIAWPVATEMGWFELLEPTSAGGLQLPFGAAAAIARLAGEFVFPGPVVEAMALSGVVEPGTSHRWTIGWAREEPAARPPRALAQVGPSSTNAVMIIEGSRILLEADIEQLPSVVSLDLACEYATLSPRRSASLEVPAAIVLSRWLTLSAAYELGMAEQAAKLAVGYALERRQFGRVIGSFQAVQQLLAQMEILRCGCESLLYATAEQLDSSECRDSPEHLLPAAFATRAYVSCHAREIVEGAIQVHGGIGFTKELPFHLFLDRIQTWRDLAGSPDWLARRLGEWRITPSGISSSNP
jgi:alkylation response protein AidB-like acyl-CoA dehydrogenase